MPATVYILETANLFCGDHDPTASKHLTLRELKLPDLNEVFLDHAPGGGRAKVEFGVGLLEKLQPTFKLHGWDPLLLEQFGLATKLKNTFTAYGEIKDRRTGASIEVKAILEGRLGKIAQDPFRRGESQEADYVINEVTHYELWFDGKEKLIFDFWTNTWRVGGVDQNSDTNRVLRIGSTS